MRDFQSSRHEFILLHYVCVREKRYLLYSGLFDFVRVGPTSILAAKVQENVCLGFWDGFEA